MLIAELFVALTLLISLGQDTELEYSRDEIGRAHV